MSDDITHDLGLLDDWLAGRGYGDETGLVLRAMTLINKQVGEIARLERQIQNMDEMLLNQSRTIKRLQEALEPFAAMMDGEHMQAFAEALDSDWTRCVVTIGDLRNCQRMLDGSTIE